MTTEQAKTELVVSYRNSTSNHNSGGSNVLSALLYLIEILHQTTTLSCGPLWPLRCILSKFYIKPQPQMTTNLNCKCCILSKFYIKPQLRMLLGSDVAGCILSKFYIKPQPCVDACAGVGVVSYRNSTSNHNARKDKIANF